MKVDIDLQKESGVYCDNVNHIFYLVSWCNPCYIKCSPAIESLLTLRADRANGKSILSFSFISLRQE